MRLATSGILRGLFLLQLVALRLHAVTVLGLAIAVGFASVGLPLVAQCDPLWLPGRGCPGVDGPVFASVAWDPDGAGPQPAQLVVGGQFQLAGSTRCRGLARCDLSTATWSAFAPEIFTRVTALAVLPNGDLVAAGDPIGSFGVTQRVARWNGAWSVLGGDFDRTIDALYVTPTGQLHAGGWFGVVGGQPAASVARWNGATWLPLGSGTTSVAGIGPVATMASLPNGDLLVGGAFDQAGGTSAASVARWNGNAWFPVGAGLPGAVTTLLRTPSGLLLAGGDFTTTFAGQSADGMAFWNGTAWSPVFGLSGGFGNPARVRAMVAMPNGRVLVAGEFVVTAGSLPNLAFFDPATSAWSAVGAGPGAATGSLGYPTTLTRLPLGRFAVGGAIGGPGAQDARNVALWNGAAWQSLGGGFGNGVACAATLANGDLVVGGGFRQIDGQAMNGIAVRIGAAWAPFGAGLGTASGTAAVVGALVPLPQGGMLVGGDFQFAGGVPAVGLAHWDGSAWAPFAGGVSNASGPAAVGKMLRTANGDLVVAGSFDAAGGVPVANIARWNGATWSSLGAGLFGTIYGLAELPNGDLLAAGWSLTQNGDALMRFDGVAWTPMPPPSPTVAGLFAMAVTPGGEVVVGGFDVVRPYGLLSRWNGVSWSPIGAGFDGEVTALHVMPDGDLVVGGPFTEVGGLPAPGLVRFDHGSSIPTALGGGLGGDGDRAAVAVIAPTANGNLAVGGFFSLAGGQPSAMFAELFVPCRPTVTVEGQGCVGSAGLVVLTATSRPWVGATFRATATGLPASSLAVVALGLQPAQVGLTGLVPFGGPGCQLFLLPLQLELLVPTGGQAALSLAIPDAPALVGQVVRQQVVPLEFDALGNVVAATSSNALALGLGTL